MDLMQWNESLSVGIDLIDDQHKTWIQRLNAITEAVQSHEGPAEISETLSFLVDYTVFHFSTEEKLMESYQYPGLAEHRQMHASLKSSLDNLVQDYREEGATQDLARSITTFLGNWLVKHIQEVDTRFGAFVKEKGIVITG